MLRDQRAFKRGIDNRTSSTRSSQLPYLGTAALFSIPEIPAR